MRAISFANQKGGSAKTTSAVNIAAGLGELGRRVLLVDLDPQSSASVWLGARDEEKGLYEVLAEDKPIAELVRSTEIEGVQIVPASPWLSRCERALASEPGAETILRASLRRAGPQWDYVIFDTPPSLGLLVLSALTASDEVIVPLEPSLVAMAGLMQLNRTIDQVRERLNPAISLSGILLCRTDRTKLTRDLEEKLRSRFGDLVYQDTIPTSVRFRESWGYAKSIFSYAGDTPGAIAYMNVARQIVSRHEQ